jgi:hypothetical protein
MSITFVFLHFLRYFSVYTAASSAYEGFFYVDIAVKEDEIRVLSHGYASLCAFNAYGPGRNKGGHTHRLTEAGFGKTRHVPYGGVEAEAGAGKAAVVKPYSPARNGNRASFQFVPAFWQPVQIHRVAYQYDAVGPFDPKNEL